MFLNRIDFDETCERWKDIIATTAPWDEIGGYLALRKHDLTIDLHNMDQDTDIGAFVVDGEAMISKFQLAYPFIVAYDQNARYPMEYLVWLSFQLQANFDRLGVLEFCANYSTEDDEGDGMEALALGFSKNADLQDFMARFDGKDLSQDPRVGYQAYLAAGKTQIG
ncbi:hypothetical protein D9M68_678920 [compost metagenome]